jgi:HK97 family phage portal protein
MLAPPAPPPAPETRRAAWQSDGWGQAALGGVWTGPSGGPEAVVSVSACVALISSAIASLPASLTIDTPDGPEPAPPSVAAWRIIERPSPYSSWPAFVQQQVGSLLLNGNSLAMVGTDGRGGIQSLTGIPWQWCSPQVIASGDGGARLAFDLVPHATPEARLLALPKRLLASEALHIKLRSDNGILGKSVIARAASAITEGAEIARMAQSNWANGMRPSGVLTAPNFLSDTQRERFSSDWLDKFSGSINSGKIPLLEGGWGLSSISMTSVDAEFLASRQFSVADICRLFNVPEVLLQIGTRSITNLDSYVTSFAQLCLTPLVTIIEAEINQILPTGIRIVLDLDGLSRGNFASVTAAICAMVQTGILSANDARETINWSRSSEPGADALMRNGAAPNWPADGPGSQHLGPSPGASGDGPGEPGNHGNEGNG